MNRLIAVLVSLSIGLVIAGTGVSAHADGEAHNAEHAAMVEQQKAELQAKVDAKRAELKSSLDAKRSEARQSLEGKRLDVCKKHERSINEVIGNSTARAHTTLERLQSHESRVRAYVAAKSLAPSNYDALSAKMDDAEAAAIAAVDVTSETKFTCAADDAARPAGEVRDAIKSQHTELKAYRQSIRDTIAAIRADAQANRSNTEGAN